VSKSKDVIVVLESQDERAKAINRGLLAEGARIARLLGGNLSALVAEPSVFSGDAWVRAAKSTLENVPFRLLLFAHTDRSSELAPLVAQNLDAPAVLDCFDIRLSDEALCYARYVCGGQFEQEVSFAHPPEIVTLSLETIEAPENASPVSLEVKKIHMPVPESAAPKKIIRRIPPDFKTEDIRYAKRILDIGAGCDKPALMELAEELAVLLEASVGTTRQVVDNGRIPKARMIGQTGKMASPELCLALGVSGSPHHVAGILQSTKILSVNSDARAPIFGVSDAGFIADLNGLLPKLIHRIKQYKDRDLT
jgi:electron transfer flavoprotein alpha subunit